MKEFSSYLPVNFRFFLKSRLPFNIFYCFCMFINKHFSTSRLNYFRILRIKNAKFSGYYFYMNTNIKGNFQICISVSLTLIYGSLRSIGAVWRSEPVLLDEAVRTHIIQSFTYREVYYFTNSSEETVFHW